MFESSKAIAYIKPNKLEFSTFMHLPLGAEDVRVRTLLTSIAPGMERLQLTGTSITSKALKFPIIAGSELVGEVIETGSSVQDVSVGEYVFVHRAEKWLDAVPLFGCLAERVVASESHVVPLRRTPKERDVLIGLLGYALSSLKKIDFSRIERILILGLGTVGLMTAEVLTYKGYGTVDAVEPFLVRGKLAAARDIAFDIGDFTAEYHDRYDLIIECTGRILMLEQALPLLKPQGTYLLMGNYDTMKIDYRLIQHKEPRLLTCSLTEDDDFFEAKYILGETDFAAEKFITHRLPAEDYEQAFDIALNRSEAIKTVLTWA
ncbi:MAG: alcohol dehydrogenase [[Candidatus Thermochlorobacteriaceae] bacterium GBChlB]|nr:MAG: alcohol dehydrogenase [[Candidatus Thermochlorobacteriaceae] bacterium GBChlB]